MILLKTAAALPRAEAEEADHQLKEATAKRLQHLQRLLEMDMPTDVKGNQAIAHGSLF